VSKDEIDNKWRRLLNKEMEGNEMAIKLRRGRLLNKIG